MGISAFYNGMIYNECFAIPIDLYGSCYNINNPITSGGSTWYPRSSPDCVYTFGVDPIWANTQNYLTFVNNMKMKLAVILGVLQMSLGVILKAFNNIYFGKFVDFFFEFLPQIILLLFLFGYMDLLIVLKWLTYYNVESLDPEMVLKIKNSPSIITLMINEFLHYGSEVTEPFALLYPS